MIPLVCVHNNCKLKNISSQLTTYKKRWIWWTALPWIMHRFSFFFFYWLECFWSGSFTYFRPGVFPLIIFMASLMYSISPINPLPPPPSFKGLFISIMSQWVHNFPAYCKLLVTNFIRELKTNNKSISDLGAHYFCYLASYCKAMVIHYGQHLRITLKSVWVVFGKCNFQTSLVWLTSN